MDNMGIHLKGTKMKTESEQVCGGLKHFQDIFSPHVPLIR